MGYNKITNLLGKLDKDEIPKFTTIKWIQIVDSLMKLVMKIKTLDLKRIN